MGFILVPSVGILVVVGCFPLLQRAAGGAPVSSRRRSSRRSCLVWWLAGAPRGEESSSAFGFAVGELHRWETEISVRPTVVHGRRRPAPAGVDVAENPTTWL